MGVSCSAYNFYNIEMLYNVYEIWMFSRNWVETEKLGRGDLEEPHAKKARHRLHSQANETRNRRQRSPGGRVWYHAYNIEILWENLREGGRTSRNHMPRKRAMGSSSASSSASFSFASCTIPATSSPHRLASTGLTPPPRVAFFFFFLFITPKHRVE